MADSNANPGRGREPDEPPPAECPQRAAVAALARGELEAEARRSVEQHLETHAACRDFFRERTVGRFPEFPNYTIIEQIGKGGFGVVYKAVHHAKEHIEALKVLFSKTPLLTSYFENEVHLIARLRHPNIALLYDAQLSQPPLFYAMEYVDGMRLNEYLKLKPVTLAERIEIIRTVAAAMSYAHRQGVIHRDLKPQNVLIDAAGQPHLVDFGIAKRLSLLSSEAGDPASATNEAPVGTVGYIAPEQVRAGSIDARADIFSLGALLFHTVTGEPARQARDAEQRLAALTARQVSRAQDLSEIIARCTADEPGDRYPDCDALAQDLDNYLHGRAITAKRNPTLWYRVTRLASLVAREHALAVRCAAVVLVALLLTFVFHTLGGRTGSPAAAGGLTRIVSIGAETRDAIRDGLFADELPDLNLYDKRSWRLLYGRFLERLAEAHPLAVAWDGFFVECDPDYDAALIRGFNALQAPLLIAAESFNQDAEPRLCPEILAAADGYGSAKSVSPDYLKTEYEVVYAIERGFNPPIPSLAMRTFAAARHPDRQPRLVVDATRQTLDVRYWRPERGDGARWLAQSDRFPLQHIERIDRPRPHTEVGDVWAHARIAARPKAFWDERTIEMLDVIQAPTAQVRAWFDGRIVVVGQMLPGEDQHANGLGELIHGVQVHAETLDALSSGFRRARFTRPELAARAVFWSGLTGMLVSLAPPLGRRKTRWFWAACGLGLIAGPWLVGSAAVRAVDPLAVELAFGIGAVLLAASALLLIKALADQEFELKPAQGAAGDDTTLPTTLLAETR